MLAIGYKLVTALDNGSLMTEEAYHIKYPVGHRVAALPDTLGIMFFDCLDDVRRFINMTIRHRCIDWKNTSLIEVIYDTDTVVKDNSLRISAFTGGTYIRKFYSYYHFNVVKIPIPTNTICCPGVYVNRVIFTSYMP